jgi:glycosyltransferase involved in cell wall biosynthesis
MAAALVAQGVVTDFIGSNDLDSPILHGSSLINFLNLRGDQDESAPLREKMVRIIVYYGRLVRYAAVARPRVFHILWNSKYAFVDRVLLMLWFRLLGRQVVLTAHNVNTAKRDSRDTWFNRLTLRIQYRLCSQLLVHTARMKDELTSDFGVRPAKVSVIPFGINNTVPTTSITRLEARARLGLTPTDRTLLFFGQIAPYKGLEYLIDAVLLGAPAEDFRLVIAGKVKRGFEDYWRAIQQKLGDERLRARVVCRIQFIPDAEVELYFKAADAVVIPYVDIFQSGVPFLAYSFGLPVIASDVGSLREDIVEGKTGYVCKPRDAADLAGCIKRYFNSDLCLNLETHRQNIRDHANERYSWAKVGAIIRAVYQQLSPETPGGEAARGRDPQV